MTTLPAPAARRVVLLIKSKKIAHQAGYFLLNGRWHSIKQDKPAPKGAPVASHPVAAGLHQPVKLSPEQVDALKYPADKAAANKEMAAFNNVHLPKLLGHAESGDATAILGHGYGSNTHGKKQAKIANYLLGEMGSKHTVVPGQKAGEHAAVATPKDADHHEQVNQAAQQAADRAVAATAAPKAPEPATSTGLAMPAFQEGKTTTGVVSYYEGQAKKILDMAAAGDAAGLAKMKADGLVPNSKGKISNTWAGKTANSKMLIAMHDQAVDQVGKKVDAVIGANPPAAAELTPAEKVKQVTQAASAAVANDPEHQAAVAIAEKVTGNSLLSQIPWDSQLLPDSNTNAKSHNGKVAQIKAMAEAGDVAGLEAFTAGKNTYGTKQKKLAALAIAALKEDASTVAATVSHEPTAKPQMPEDITGHHTLAQKVEDALATGDKEALSDVMDVSEGAPAESNLGKVHAYAKQALDHLDGEEPKQPAAADGGPKEGDTKPGADGGTLVFKDGHWHKQEQPQAAEPTAQAEASPSAVGGLPEVPLFSSSGGNAKWAANYQKVAQQLHAAVAANGAAGLKPFVTSHKDGRFTIKTDTFNLKKVGPNDQAEYRKQMHAYVTALKDAAGKPKKAPKAAPAAAPAPAAVSSYQPGVESMDGWQQTGPQGGSNPGGKFKDAEGVEWYCKFPGNEDVAKSEVLAAKLYAAAGIAGQDAKLVTKDGKLGIASKWQTVSKLSPAALSKADGVAAGFAVDAWLGNWDVVGMGYDNLQVGPDGKAVRVDAGGSLEYRAQGGKKSFGDHVVEIDSLRDAKINPQAAAVFGKMSQADITASVSKVLGVSDSKIHALVHAYGPGDAAAKQKMIDTLIARKADLATKYPKAKKEKKVKPFKPEKISEPPSFMNWGGSGKSGPSSKEFLNAANEAAVQSIYAAAQTGSLDAIKNLSASIYNKESGEVTGSAPVLEHPSQHVKGYAQQAINEINYQLNPPKRFRFEGGHPLHSLNSSYPSHKGALHSNIAKVGKYILLGEPGTVSLESLALPKHTYQSGAITQATFSPAAKKSIASMPETQKQAIKAYTGSGYQSMNQSLWAGNPSGAAKSAGEALHALGHDITPGTVLSRKISVQGADLDQILGSTGKILQEPAIMSTSIRPSSWSGNVQLKMHVGPGVKGLWVGKGSVGSNGALSNHSSEDELILPPNTRLLILSVKKSSGPDADGFGAGVGHVIEAVILPTQASA